MNQRKLFPRLRFALPIVAKCATSKADPSGSDERGELAVLLQKSPRGGRGSRRITQVFAWFTLRVISSGSRGGQEKNLNIFDGASKKPQPPPNSNQTITPTGRIPGPNNDNRFILRLQVWEVELMFKKLFLLGGGAALLMGLLFSRSHIHTTVGMVKQQVQDSVPIDFELKRARQMIKDLHPEIEKNLRLIAQEEVEVASLESNLNRADERLAKDRSDIKRLTTALESGKQTFVFAKHTYSAREVEADLVSRFAEFKTQAATAKANKKILNARQAGLQAARSKLDAMLDAKRQLEVDVENLEARLAMVDVARTTSSFNFDDSHLSKTRELIDMIGTRVEVAEKLVNSEVHYFDRIQLDEPEANVDITDEIAKYFGEDRVMIESYANNN